jgi:hypothetical protein
LVALASDSLLCAGSWGGVVFGVICEFNRVVPNGDLWLENAKTRFSSALVEREWSHWNGCDASDWLMESPASDNCCGDGVAHGGSEDHLRGRRAGNASKCDRGFHWNYRASL